MLKLLSSYNFFLKKLKLKKILSFNPTLMLKKIKGVKGIFIIIIIKKRLKHSLYLNKRKRDWSRNTFVLNEV